MKKLIIVALAAVGLGGCVAVPGPYYGDTAVYYPAPAVGVGIYSAPGYYHGGHGRRHGPRHHRHHRHYR